MRKHRFGITVGIQDKCSHLFRTSVLICCTHGGTRSCLDELDHPELSWTPNSSEPQLAVHGTSLRNWGLIVKDGAMKSMDRTDIHFSVYRKGMLIKEMSQLLKTGGIFLFINPSELAREERFTVIQNLNDVVKVEAGSGGMDIRYLVSAIDGSGRYADMENPYYQTPAIPDNLRPLLLEFIQQLRNPATALFDDRHGTMGPRARKKMKEATVLAEGYEKVSQSLSLAEAAEHIPRIKEMPQLSKTGGIFNSFRQPMRACPPRWVHRDTISQRCCQG